MLFRSGKEVEMKHMASDAKLMELIKHNELRMIHSLEPTLGDIFMEITGRRLS